MTTQTRHSADPIVPHRTWGMGLMCTQRGSRAENREMRSGRPEMTDAFKDPRKNAGFTQSSVKSHEEGSGVIWSGLFPIVLPLAPAGKDAGCLEARQLWQDDNLLSSWFMTPSPGQAIEMKFPCREAGQKELTFSSPKGARKKIRIFYSLWICPNFDWQHHVVTYKAHTQQSYIQVQTNK